MCQGGKEEEEGEEGGRETEKERGEGSTNLYFPNLQHSLSRNGFHVPSFPNPMGLTLTTSFLEMCGSILLHRQSTSG